MSRRKSFKKSLRDSIRRLRKRRSNRGGREKQRTGSGADSPASDKKSPGTYPRSPPSPIPADSMKPVERAIEARGLGVTEDGKDRVQTHVDAVIFSKTNQLSGPLLINPIFWMMQIRNCRQQASNSNRFIDRLINWFKEKSIYQKSF